MAKNPFSISFSKNAGSRKAYRAHISGLHVKVAGRPAVYVARDLSPTGVGLGGFTGMRQDEVFEVGLYLKGARITGGLTAKVTRVTSDFTGLLFINPDRRQANAIHELVLAEQKRQAEERKKSKIKKG